MEPIRVAVSGALGRMGRAVAQAALGRDDLAIVACFDRVDEIGAGLTSREAALDLADVVVDFTSGEASAELVRDCVSRGGPALVIGSTGMTLEAETALDAAARQIAIVRSGNFSLGVNVLLGLVRQAARALPAEAYDIEITEAHHRRKLDSPSGTALMLGRAAAEARGVDIDQVSARARDGDTGPRPSGEIGFSVLRGGGIVGEHGVVFAAEDEIVTLSHSARDRSLFARGALTAAVWVAARPPGLYDMQDVLGFEVRR